MYNFFVPENSRQDNTYIITDQNYNHIINVLRMKCGDIFLVSENSVSNLCEISEINDRFITANIIEENYNNSELPVKIYLFQGLPKSDKFELIIQKSVELGVYSIIPTRMSRCIVKLDDKKAKNKKERWQLISESAAKQSKRNIIPEITDVMDYKAALDFASAMDLILVPYESHDGMHSTKKALSELKPGMSVAIFIGPEGGFEDDEIEAATEKNARIISLGKRILRTETAAITSVGMCMLYSETDLEK